MAYSNWTILGTGTSAAQLNSTVPFAGWGSDPGPPYGPLPAGFGNYCRKLNGDGMHIWNINNPNFKSVPPGKIQTLQFYVAFDAAAPNQIFYGRIRESTGQYGYNIGVKIGSSGYTEAFVLALSNNAQYVLSGYWGSFGTSPYGPSGGFLPLKLVVKSIDANTDEIEAFVERDGGGNVYPGTGNWVSNSISYISGTPLNTGVTQNGNVLTVPSSSPCFAPHVADSNTAFFWNGNSVAFLDGVKTTVENI